MYELMIVANTDGSQDLVSRVEKILKDSDATEIKTEKLGKKQLAYAIKKQTEADYSVLTFNVAGSAISDLTDMLRLEQDVLLRYLLTVQKRKKALKKKFAAKKEEVVVKEEKKAPKVTVVTRTKGTEGSKSKVSKVTKVSKVSKGKN